MYVDEPPKDGNIPDFNISKIDICPFRACQRSFRLFQGNFSKDIHLRSRLLCFTQNDHTGHAGFKICPFLKWAQYFSVSKYDIFKYRIRCIITKKSGIIHAIVCPDFLSFKIFSSEKSIFFKIFSSKSNRLYFFVALIKKPIRQI